MIRVGVHYIEPRRAGFFLIEEVGLWLAFLGAALLASRALGRAPQLDRLLVEALAAGLLIEGALALADLHDLRVALADAARGGRLARVLGGALVVAAAVLGLATRAEASLPLTVAGLSGACLASMALRAGLPALAQRVPFESRVFLVGEGQAAHRLLREVARDGRVEVVGFCGPRAGGIADKARASGAATVVVAVDDRRGTPVDELMRCRTEGLDVATAATFAARALRRLPVELVSPSDLIYGDGFVRATWVRAGRRVVSVAAAIVLLVLTAPLLLVAAILIKRDSSGPVLFRQTRAGRSGRPYQMLKLRTMHQGAESRGAAVWATTDDPRITRVGRWLRRYRVDELPQLINVLRGDMDLIGPRPERPEFVAMLERHIPYYALRHLVRPGITGWAQVRYPYAASLEEAREKLQYDLYYVRHLSLSFDLLILLLTARTILLGRGAR